MKPLKPCNHITCRTLIPFDQKYCAQHTQVKREGKQYDAFRNREEKKYRDIYRSTRWRKLREQILLRDDYLCQSCLAKGIFKEAEMVHHKVEIKQDITKAYDADNLVAWCNACHNSHHKGGQAPGWK